MTIVAGLPVNYPTPEYQALNHQMNEAGQAMLLARAELHAAGPAEKKAAIKKLAKLEFTRDSLVAQIAGWPDQPKWGASGLIEDLVNPVLRLLDSAGDSYRVMSHSAAETDYVEFALSHFETQVKSKTAFYFWLDVLGTIQLVQPLRLTSLVAALEIWRGKAVLAIVEDVAYRRGQLEPLGDLERKLMQTTRARLLSESLLFMQVLDFVKKQLADGMVLFDEEGADLSLHLEDHQLVL